MDHRLHCGDPFVRQEGREGRADHRLAGNLAVLLGQIPADPVPAAGGDNDGRNPPGHDDPSSVPDSDTALAHPPEMCEPGCLPARTALFADPFVHRVWTERRTLTILHCSTCADAGIG
jgi:hypothetical protein